MQVGDVVVVTEVYKDDLEFFSVGDKATLVERCDEYENMDNKEYFDADFNGHGNPTVNDDGIWYVNGEYSKVELVTDDD